MLTYHNILEGYESKNMARAEGLMKRNYNMNTSSSAAAVLPLGNDTPQPVSSYDTFDSLPLIGSVHTSSTKSIVLLNGNEELLIQSEEEFLRKLKIEKNSKVKVVSIFGKTGVGKSYTLNHTFFNGDEVFCTSGAPKTCTSGVWAYYNQDLKIICLDTESMLGVSNNENQRTRLLLKILAVSDVIIYRTIDPRLESDMYKFLGGASKAYQDHLTVALQKVLEKHGIRSSSANYCLGPAVIIFHQTNYTDPLQTNLDESPPEDVIQANLASLGLDSKAFSSIKYFGIKAAKTETYYFSQLQTEVQRILKNSNRPPKVATYIYLFLKDLNEKFKNQLKIKETSPSQLLSCQEKCKSCNAVCSLSADHTDEGSPHSSSNKCRYHDEYKNEILLCKKCLSKGTREIVTYQTEDTSSWGTYLSNVWAGNIIDCPNCGKIYEASWFGYKEPTDEAVVIETAHIWPGESSICATQNSGQKVLDGITNMTNVVVNIGSQPTKMVTDWVTDQIAPSYWKKNYEILSCHICKISLNSNYLKHHCRACGEGFCDKCSSKTQVVPGWGEAPVRVCDNCYKNGLTSINNTTDEQTDTSARIITETVINKFSNFRYMYDVSKNYIKEKVRPANWVPDEECINCSVCTKLFDEYLKVHHCRDCGKGVCDNCSKTSKPVPKNGWTYNVRVCDICCKNNL